MTGALTFRAVRLALHGLGGYRTVQTVEDAAECLLNHWPTHKGRVYDAACEIILGALNGQYTAEAARAALITAADEATIEIIE
ncbi:DUF982 domain-containing protein [Rhizobium sp. BK251]|uniref:DUF982 domain-containing protein n=1 Tax=Rhizobium sp. BK251 TaxID=2512125 RepID=UPI00104D9207|nr:DUF982 domain-containing protein [Rhizobium sp. BK251]TCL66443.1 uncharacterized protein DUF982 [Rhizobium sp. BK251]